MGKIYRLLLATLVFYGSFAAHSPAQNFTESEVKAAYIFKLVKFIYWPEDKNTAEGITLCIREGRDAANGTGEALATIAGKQQTLRTLKNPDFSSLAQCHVLFIDQSQESALRELLVSASKHQIVTISDIRGFARRGGIFGFVSDRNGRISIEYNKSNATENAISVSADLLNMIRVIE